ncbi:hypothetical protein H6A13_01395 [Mordavella massiliensis]|uniref:Uncharacterized protein n=1 Tax=Mordavella massiliensis TaxID=1871024 RepID=A0A939BAW6_9CLOT|nr:DUF6147 family protein [Mordavella massiliensis]MBM6825759.1 hypothetical protein [Mordavella massiliensis]
MLFFSIPFFTAVPARAADKPVLDGSILTQDRESIGTDTKITRGVDLMAGYSKIVRLGPEKIYAGGTTMASREVEKVMISVMVERAQEGDDAWSFYDSWQKENHNVDRVGSNRTLEVEGGYYYRVRCIHSANDDVSSSFTNGVYVEEDSIFPDILPEL